MKWWTRTHLGKSNFQTTVTDEVEFDLGSLNFQLGATVKFVTAETISLGIPDLDVVKTKFSNGFGFQYV